MAERGVEVSAHIVLTWVPTFGPLLADTVRCRARKPGARWWYDETHTTIRGRQAYLYRVIEEHG